MDNQNLLIVFITFTSVLWLFLGAITFYQTNTASLKKRGYTDEYIAEMRKSSISLNLGIALVMPIIVLVAASVVWLIFGEFSLKEHLMYIVLISLVFITPFPILELKKANKKAKELAKKTKKNIVIDVNYQILHIIFKPRWEIVVSTLYILFCVMYAPENYLGIGHLIFVWLFYLIARSYKFMIRQSMKDGYLMIFIFMIFNHILVIYHFSGWRLFDSALLGWIGYFFAGLLTVLLLAKLIYYIYKFPRFKSELSIHTNNQGELNVNSL